MEVIQGKQCHRLDGAAVADRMSGYSSVLVDIGTGDGRFVRHAALADAGCFAVGVDACRENLRATSRAAPGNALFVIANAYTLPMELTGRASRLTINFPWGSLLAGLLEGSRALLAGLWAVTQPGATLEVRLNAGALAEAGWALETGGARVRAALLNAGMDVEPVAPMNPAALHACPTTWARRLLFGRDPRGVYLRARRPGLHPRHGQGVASTQAAGA